MNINKIYKMNINKIVIIINLNNKIIIYIIVIYMIHLLKMIYKQKIIGEIEYKKN